MASIYKDELDLGNVRKEIDWFHAHRGSAPKFIVMSELTLKKIIQSVFLISKDTYTNDSYSCIFGIPISTCSIIEFGEFEVVG